MAKKNNNLNSKEIKYIKLAYEQAAINLGSTKKNPSVGCVVVKNNAVISSGRTSINGRPHAEANALKYKLNFKDTDLYVTLEPCSHFGETPPCVKEIINNRIRKVIFSINDIDPRSKNLAYKKLKKAKITIKRNILIKHAKNFYKSYFLQSSKQLPLIDAKLAVSKDYLTINKKAKWITSNKSRKVGNFLRSKYDCILSTSKTINEDNSQLDCRIEGLEKKSPSVIIIDRFFIIKKNLKIFKNIKRDIFIFTQTNNNLKERYFKKIGVKIVKLKKIGNSNNDVTQVYFLLKQFGFSRILIESGMKYINKALHHNLIKNFYLFRSSFKLKNNGKNNIKKNLIKKLKNTFKNKVKINLNGENLYKIHL